MAVSLHLSIGSDRHLRSGLRRAEKTSCKTLLESPLSTVSLLISSRALFLVDLLSSFRQFKCRASPLKTSEAACWSPVAIAAILSVVMATCNGTTNKRLLYGSFRFKISNFIRIHNLTSCIKFPPQNVPIWVDKTEAKRSDATTLKIQNELHQNS